MLTIKLFFALGTRLFALPWAMLAFCFPAAKSDQFRRDNGAIIRGDVSQKEIALVFTGHEFAEGGALIRGLLREKRAQASFFFTGDFYRAPQNEALIRGLLQDGHYLGPHSDEHLLYCSWDLRDKLLVTKEEFTADILENYRAMEKFGLSREKAPLFIPPYEWYNRAIVDWAQGLGLSLINFTPGTSSNADYTTPEMPNYRPSKEIFRSILDYERSDPAGLSGFILLLHIGTHPDRKDKFYLLFGPLLDELQKKGYAFVRVDDLLSLSRILTQTRIASAGLTEERK